MIGLNGIRSEDPALVGECWERALASDRPTVFEVVCDPEVPPLPPHITLKQAKSFASAVMRGDRGRRRMIAQSIRQKLPEVLPGK
jgi:pyruvate dehydrogenase (quinone)